MTTSKSAVPERQLAAAPAIHSSRTWSVGLVETSARSRGTAPSSRLLAVFDVVDDVINRADREARAFVTLLARVSTTTDLSADEAAFVLEFRTLIATLATEAGVHRVDEFTSSWEILMRGTILKAVAGDLESARRGREMAVGLIARFSTSPIEPVASDDMAFAFDYEGYYDAGDPDLVVAAP